MANLGLAFNYNGWYFRLNGKYVGELYSDNYDNNLENYLQDFPGFVSYYDNVNEAYFVSDFFSSSDFILLNAITPWQFFVLVNNIFNNFA